MTELVLAPIGRRGYLADWFRTACSSSNVTVVTVDSNPYAAGLGFGDRIVHIESDSALQFSERLAAIVARGRGGLIMPLHDEVAWHLSKQSIAPHYQLLTPIGLASDAAWDKVLMAKLAESSGIAVPEHYPDLISAHGAVGRGDVVIKPRFGSAGLSTAICSPESDEARSHVDLLTAASIPFIIQRRISGAEFGLDVVGHLNGEFAGWLARRKLRMRAGETDLAVIESPEWAPSTARRLHDACRHAGAIDCDFMVDSEGVPHLIDLNPRFGGGYPLSHAAGANVPALLAWELRNGAPHPDPESYLSPTVGLHVAKQDWPVVCPEVGASK